jgi:hypothetical protein
MREKMEQRRGLMLLSSLLLVFVMHPVLEHGPVNKLILAILTFVPLILANIKMAERKEWFWPHMLLIAGAILCTVVGTAFSLEPLLALQWILMTVAFGLSVAGLFSYLERARDVTADHLYTAASIYLLLGVSWFSLYTAVDRIYPGSFVATGTGPTNRPADLLYFSLCTLTTLGYGDIVAVTGEVRMLAVLEAATGVMYVAITVALLVTAYKERGR